jgi:hypothetical protein
MADPLLPHPCSPNITLEAQAINLLSRKFNSPFQPHKRQIFAPLTSPIRVKPTDEPPTNSQKWQNHLPRQQHCKTPTSTQHSQTGWRNKHNKHPQSNPQM